MTDNNFIENDTERIVQRTVQVPVERVVREQVNPVVAQAVEPSHWSKWWWLPLLLLGLLGAILWHGCHTHDAVANRTETTTIHTTITETMTGQAVATVEPAHLTINTDEETRLRDDIHNIVPDIEHDGAAVVDGAKSVCAGILNGVSHGVADIAGFFHIGTEALDDARANQIVSTIEGYSWCHR